MARKPHKQTYMARNGAKQYKPSMEYLMSMSDSEGFCVACGETQDGIEPDGRKYTCEHCGQPKVYGRDEIVLMGLTY